MENKIKKRLIKTSIALILIIPGGFYLLIEFYIHVLKQLDFKSYGIAIMLLAALVGVFILLHEYGEKPEDHFR